MANLKLQWKQYLWDCYNHGRDFTKDDTKVRELLGNYVFLERPQDLDFPLNDRIEDPEVFLENLKKGLYDFQGYPFKTEALYDYVTSLCDDNHIFCSDFEERKALGLDDKVPFVYTYPERLIHMLNVVESYSPKELSNFEYINQYSTISRRLLKNLGSNRAVATLYHPGIDMFRDDIPCLNWLQATVRNDALELHCMFRSNDLYGAWPSNMLFLTYLGLCLGDDLRLFNEDITFNGIHYHSSSLHIYHTNLNEVKEVLDDGFKGYRKRG